MGLVIDVIIEYLIRLVSRAVRRRRSSDWPRVEGLVLSSKSGSGATAGSVVAEISYVYTCGDTDYPASSKKPFWTSDSAEEYATGFSAGQRVVIRVAPGRPEKSVLVEEDQRGSSVETAQVQRVACTPYRGARNTSDVSSARTSSGYSFGLDWGWVCKSW